MLILLTIILLLASVFVLFLKRNRESIYFFLMCLSLSILFSGIFIFIAKKGGYPKEILHFFFLSAAIKTKAQFLLITLQQLGFIIAVGRTLFPLFLLELTCSYTTIPFLKRHCWIQYAIAILPLLTLILYFPPIYKTALAVFPHGQPIIVQFSYTWIMGYVLLSVILLIREFFAISMPFFRQRFAPIIIFIFALTGLYILYCGQDPGQVYHFYSFDSRWLKGLGYMQYAPGIAGYIFIVAATILCALIGCISLIQYTQGIVEIAQDEIAMENKFDIARTGASVFVHSIKNQLLTNRVLFKRIRAELEKENLNRELLNDLINNLHVNNEQLLQRSDELYKSVKSKSVRLVPVPLSEIAEATLDRFHKKYPEGKANIHFDPQAEVLADKNYLSEALYNLLINGWEANLVANREYIPIEMISYDDYFYTIIEIKDSGIGIPRLTQKKIFEPFYTSKNSNFNWGMGLYHVRTIVKSHFGSLRVESKQDAGASFFVMLPKYTAQKGTK